MVDATPSLQVRSLRLRQFRNYQTFALDEIGKLTIFVGRNGVGKTNVLESIQLMTAATSFRHPQISQLIKEGCETGLVSMELADGNRELSEELRLEPGKKRYMLNGKAKGISDIRGTLPAVVFTPDDLNLVKKSSSIKRDALDNVGIQLSKNYGIVRHDYEKIVRFKNRLLKDDASDALVKSADESLIVCGSQLFCFRTELYSRMLPLVKKNYAALSNIGHASGQDAASFQGAATNATGQRSSEPNCPGSSEPAAQGAAAQDATAAEAAAKAHQPIGFDATYLPSWEHLNKQVPRPGAPAPSLDREQVRAQLAQSLAAHEAEERRRARSLAGPHNDKLTFYLDGRDAASFASQGQQRSIVLAWKLAEMEVIRQSLGVRPVLLLDDVMSELDATRRDMLVGFVTEDTQTFITATDLSAFNESLLSRAKIVELT